MTNSHIKVEARYSIKRTQSKFKIEGRKWRVGLVNVGGQACKVLHVATIPKTAPTKQRAY